MDERFVIIIMLSKGLNIHLSVLHTAYLIVHAGIYLSFSLVSLEFRENISIFLIF